MQRAIKKFLCRIVFATVVLADALAGPCRTLGENGDCTFFSDISVQEEAARGLIEVAMKSDVKPVSGYYELKGRLTQLDDASFWYADSLGAAHTYDFKSLELPHGNVNTERENIRTKLYPMFGLKYYPSIGGYGKENAWTKALSKNELEGYNQDAYNFGMALRPKESRNAAAKTYEIVPQVSTFDANKWNLVYNGEKIIDSTEFKDLQFDGIAGMKDFLRTYVVLRMGLYGLVVEKFACASSTISIKKSGVKAPDDLLPCSVTYVEPSDVGEPKRIKKQVGFLVDDIADTSESVAEAGRGVLACKAAGGSATDDGVCAGFTQAMCNTLEEETGIQTEWKENKGCILAAKSKHNKLNNAVDIVGKVGMAAVSLILAPVTGGGSLALIAVIGASIVLIGTVTSMALETAMDIRFSGAVTGANLCLINTCGGVKANMDVANKSEECSECAMSTAKELVVAMTEFEGHFSDRDAKTAAYLLEVLMTALSGDITPICLAAIAEGTEKSWMTYAKSISDATVIVGGIVSLGAGITGSATGKLRDVKTVGEFFWNKLKPTKKLSDGKKVFSTAQKFMSKPFTKLKSIADETMVAFKQLANNKSVKFATEWGDNLDAFVGKIDSSIDFVENWPSVCPNKEFPCSKNLLDVVDKFGEYCGIM